MFKIHPSIIAIFNFNFSSDSPRQKYDLILSTSIYTASGNVVRQNSSAG